MSFAFSTSKQILLPDSPEQFRGFFFFKMKANLKQGFYRLMELPVEVWFQILESLESYVDVCRLACTSKLLNEICTQNPDVWKKHLKILFPLILNRINQSNEIKQNAFWRQKFQQRLV